MAKTNKKENIKELIRCGRDPAYFLNTYAKIQHPVKGLIPFNTYGYQKDIIDAFIKNRMNVILKARQLGITTITAGYIAWLILFHRDRNVLIVATKQDTARNMVRVVKNIFKYLPKWMIALAGGYDANNRLSVELNNGSRVKAQTTSTDVGRSEAVSFLVVDEVAHIKNFDEIWVGLWPTISTGGQVALFSTPNGTGNFFHSIFKQAQNGENNFNCKFGKYVNPHNPNEVHEDRLMWWVHPDHDEVWFKAETAGKSPREIAQEYLCNFNASGDTFIHHEDIAKLESLVKPPKKTFALDRNVWIWEEPDPAGVYIIPCDVSRGDAQDYSAFHILRIDVFPLEQVGEYKGKIKPDLLGMLLMAVSKTYNNAVIAPENNSGWSGQTILKIQEAGCPFLYYSRRRKPKMKDNYAVDPYYAQDRNDYLPGYAVTSATRTPMLGKMEQYIRMGEARMYSSRFLDEVKTLIVTETGRVEAQRGENDDLVMALGGGLWVREEAFLYTYRSDEMAKAMVASMSTSNTKTSQFRDFNYNGSIYDKARIQQFVQNQNKIVMANGEEIDLNWLISSG